MSNVVDIYELSPMQQGMLFHSQFNGDKSTYYEQCWCDLTGNLNIDRFKKAWQLTINHHDVLRSEFHWENLDTPVQVVYDSINPEWEYIDWTIHPVREDDNHYFIDIKFEQYLANTRIKGFNLDKAPLLKFCLIKINTEHYRFVWHYHHILIDGWCGALVIKDMLQCYDLLSKGALETDNLLSSSTSYRHYIEWLNEQDKEKAISYWEARLKNYHEPTRISQFNHNNESGFDKVEHYLSEIFSDKLKNYAKQQRLTLNTIFQGAWALLLSLRTGEAAVSFGAVVAGRPAEIPQVEKIVGLFLNSLPIYAELKHDQTVIEFLSALQHQLRESEQYAYCSVAEIKAVSPIDNNDDLFETLVIFENYPLSMIESAKHLISDISISSTGSYERTNIPLCLKVIPSENILVDFSFLTEYFTREFIQQLLTDYIELLTLLINNPEQSITSIYLDRNNYQINNLSKGRLINVDQQSVFEKIQKIAFSNQQQSEKKAVYARPSDSLASNYIALSYQELIDNTHRLANYFIESGLKENDRVAVCLDRHDQLITTLLAIWQCGAAYIPLDPKFPSHRLAIIVEDAAPNFVVTHSSNKAIIPAVNVSAKMIVLDESKKAIEMQDAKSPAIVFNPERLAYIIFTSGSTGRPKGVPITHANLNNFTASISHKPGITAETNFLAVTTMSFDIAALEIFVPLINGGTVVLADEDACSDPFKLIHLINDHHINAMQATPSTWRLLTEANWQNTHAIKILCGGEALPSQLANDLLSLLHIDSELWNMYGPTETSIWSAAFKVEQQHLYEANVPVGQALDNTQLLILDKLQRPVMPHVNGELYIGGLGLSPGYWNREDLTQQSFINYHGFEHQAIKLYKTGDEMRYREDGLLSFIGRLDGQIKLRGFRIELGDIEAVCEKIPNVEQAIALLVQDDDPYIAIVIRSAINEKIITAEQIKQQCYEQLPYYMQPKHCEFIEQFPLTPNAKIDRKALINNIAKENNIFFESAKQNPQATIKNYQLQEEHKVIANIWKKVLSVDFIDLNSDFFKLGGHSLLAMRLISEINQLNNTSLTVRDVFECSKFSLFYHLVINNDSENKAITKIEKSEKLLLSWSQQRQLMLQRFMPDSNAYNIPCVISIDGNLNIDYLKQSIQTVCQRHEILRSYYPETFIENIDNLTYEVIHDLEVELSLINLDDVVNSQNQQEAIDIILGSSNKAFDLSQGPLWRLTLLKISDQQHILIWVFHHIIIDEWSLSLIVNECQALYQQLSLSKPSYLPAIDYQYADYAFWQRNINLQKQSAYWQKQLKAIPDCINLPTDYPRQAIRKDQGDYFSLLLTGKQSEGINELCQTYSVTPFIVLLTVFQSLLWRYSNDSSVCTGIPIANREREEFQPLIGLFVNTLTIRADHSNELTFQDLLEQLRHTLLDAYDNQDIPFEKVLSDLDIARNQSYSPLFQVFFNVEDLPESHSSDNHELNWQIKAINKTTSKFDLSLIIQKSKNTMAAKFEYRTDIFKESSIARMAGHFSVLLDHFINNPAVIIGNINYLSEQENQQIQQWNDTDFIFDNKAHNICQLLNNKSLEQAVSDENCSITYQELQQQANAIAEQLINAGIGSDEACTGYQEQRVAVYMERSVDLLPCIIAIIKVGATYLPIEPSYPLARKQYILEDSKAAAIIVNSRQSLENIANESIYQLDVAQTQNNNDNFSINSDWISNEQACYMIYTSGSTGQPKGVINTHKGLINRLLWMQKAFNLTQSDKVLLKTSLGFDVSVWELFWPLISEASLFVAKPESHKDPNYLVKTIIEESITTLHFVPAMFAIFLETERVQQCANSLRRIILSGEALSPQLNQRFFEIFGHDTSIDLYNLYGPTEAAIDVSFWRCKPQQSPVPIGKPINNTQLHIVNELLQSQAIGIPGEILISGDNLARGYFEKDNLTNHAFIYDNNGKRYYKTGDMAYRQDDGNIVYIGRNDFQIKLRGLRIELNEIENALNDLPLIESSIVTSQMHGGNQRIIAYCKLIEQGSEPSYQLIKKHLATVLPDYMIPAKFIYVEEWPINNSGKIDRKTLPKPIWLNDKSNYNAPTTELAIKLAAIWSDVLNIDNIGIDDNYFELGGDSIQAMQISHKAIKSQINLEPNEIFIYQSITALEERLAKKSPIELIDNSTESFDLINQDEINFDDILSQVDFGDND